MRFGIVVVVVAACAFAVQGQVSNALVMEARFPWTVVRDNLLKMAEKMPADDYGFKPVPESPDVSRNAWSILRGRI